MTQRLLSPLSLATAVFALGTLGTLGCSEGGRSEQVVVERVGGDGAAQQVQVKTQDGEAVLDLDEKDGQARVRVKDGDREAVFTTGGKVPADFPLPILSGAEVVSALSSKTGDKTAHQVALTLKGGTKEAASFYEQALKKKGLTVERHDVEAQGQKLVALRGTSGSAEAVVSITSTGDDTTVSISWSAQ